VRNHGRSERHLVAMTVVGIIMLEGSQSWPLALLATEDVKIVRSSGLGQVPLNFDFTNSCQIVVVWGGGEIVVSTAMGP
jgi:hypothetical protein